MRVAPYLLSAILLAAMFGTTHAAPTSIEGSWSGSGIAKFRNRTDRMVCRVNFARLEQKSFRVWRFALLETAVTSSQGACRASAGIAIAATSSTPSSTRGGTCRFRRAVLA